MDKDTEIRFAALPQIRNAQKRMTDARTQPHINQICSMIWQTNELHLLFADTGIGKSILAVALSDAISKGERFMNLINENEPLPVLFYDFELSDRQYIKRYSNENGEEYPFSSNFFIDTIDFLALTNTDLKADFDDLLFEKIKYDIQKIKAKVLVIDNLTFLNTQSTQDTQIALNVMRRLNELKKEFDLSILVLAHTPKRYNNTPITIVDLGGSKHLGNFADSVSAIGKSSKGKSIRYWKQVKPSRSGELLYDTSNVLECEIVKDNNFLSFQFIDYADEYDHLNHETGNKETGNKETPQLVFEVVKLLEQKLTYDEIANKLAISKGTITKWKGKYHELFVSVSTVSMNGSLGNTETGNETTEF